MASLMDSHSSSPEALRSLGAAPPGDCEQSREEGGGVTTVSSKMRLNETKK